MATGSVPFVSSLDIAHFKEVVGHYVTGVVVVTAATEGGPAGFTCQTFGSLSLEPILISFAAKSAGESWSRVKHADAVAVNILGSEQEALARVFATSGIDKFEGVGWSDGPRGTPLLDGAIAHLEGALLSATTHGDHDVVVVAVDFVASHPGSPLVYYRGGFGEIA
jgi:flavin reductase (DIM6/NTAB) family NADH-FMN oxidoreductase RutF